MNWIFFAFKNGFFMLNVFITVYFYQTTSVTPMAAIGDFGADNACMFESPCTDYDVLNANLLSQEVQFSRNSCCYSL